MKWKKTYNEDLCGHFWVVMLALHVIPALPKSKLDREV